MMEWLTDTLQFLQMHVMPFAKLHALQIFVGVVIFIMWGWLLGIKFHKPSTVSGEVADKETKEEKEEWPKIFQLIGLALGGLFFIFM